MSSSTPPRTATPSKKTPPPKRPPSKSPAMMRIEEASQESENVDVLFDQATRILQKYDPKMVPVLPNMFKKFEGKEQQLVSMLIKKHGPVPTDEELGIAKNPTAAASTPPTTPTPKQPPPNKAPMPSPKPATAAASSSDSVESQCRRILATYDPRMVPVLQNMLTKFEGKEQQLLSMLIKKHGPVPPLAEEENEGKSIPAAPTTSQGRAGRGAGEGEGEGESKSPPRSRAASTASKTTKVPVVAPAPPTTDKEGNPIGSPSSTPRTNATKSDRPLPSPTAPATSRDEIEAQIIAVLEAHDPKMVKAVPSMMKKFEGKELQLLSMIQKKHGVVVAEPQATLPAASTQSPQPQRQKQEATVPTTTSSSSSSASSAIEAQIAAILREHDPATIDAVPSMMRQFEGKEAQLLHMIQKKYGVAPTPSTRTTTTAVTTAAAAAALPPPPTTVRTTATTASSADVAPDQRPRGPSQVGSGTQPRPRGASTTTGPSSSSSSSSSAISQKQRLQRFYAKYEPSKLGSIDEIVEQYVGREEALWAFLTGKYGPEPSNSNSAPSPPSSAVESPAAANLFHPNSVDNEDSNNLQQRSEHRIRLLRYFQHYDPARILAVDAELAKFGPGNEQQMWQAIARQYNNKPEPTASSLGGNDALLLLDRVRRMYVHYDPTVLSTELPAAMREFRGREADLLKKLTQKYGREPPNSDSGIVVGGNNNAAVADEKSSPSSSSSSSRNTTNAGNLNATQLRALRMYQRYDPNSLLPAGASEFDRMLKQYTGREYEWIADLTQKYGPEPNDAFSSGDGRAHSHSHSHSQSLHGENQQAPPESRTMRRVRAMFDKYDPSAAANIPILLDRYAKSARSSATSADEAPEERLLQDLISRYGEEPPLREMQDREVLQQRAASVVAHYDPESSDRIPSLLQRFKGREDQLLRTLVRKYGPEPLDALGVSSFAKEAAIPPTVGENIAEIRELIAKHEPESAPAIPGLLQRYNGKEETLLQLLKQRYGTSILVEVPNNNNNVVDGNIQQQQQQLSSPSSSTQRVRQVSFIDQSQKQQQQQNQQRGGEQDEDPRIRGSVISIENRIKRILEINQPELVATAEKFAQVMKEHEGAEQAYLDDLVAKHGPEPSLSSQHGKAKSDHPQEASARAKLVALFTHYDRMQLPRVEDWLERYTGREDEMLAAVHKKYAVPAPQQPPEWVAALQKLCLAHGMHEIFLEKLVSSMGSAATKDNVTFELLNMWYPDFVASLLTDEGQRRTLVAKRLARFLSVVAPGRVQEIPEMMHQVVAGGQSSDVVLGDMLLTFFREAMVNAAVPRLDHTSLRDREDATTTMTATSTSVAGVEKGRSAGAGFIGHVEQLKKLLDVWHQQRHHTRTVPQLLGTSATDLIRFSKVIHRAVGPDELIVKSTRTLGTDTESDSASFFGSNLPAGGRTLAENDSTAVNVRTASNANPPRSDGTGGGGGQQSSPSSPPNPLLFSRFGIASHDFPRTRWGCSNCEELRNFAEMNESRWQQRMKEQELKLWRMMESSSVVVPPRIKQNSDGSSSNNNNNSNNNNSQNQNSLSSSSSSSVCSSCQGFKKEIDHLRHRVHQLQTNYQIRSQIDAAADKERQEQEQERQRNDDGSASTTTAAAATTTTSTRAKPSIFSYPSPRSLFRVENPPPASINRYRQHHDHDHHHPSQVVPLYHTSSTAPSNLHQPSAALQRSQDLWKTLYQPLQQPRDEQNNNGVVVLPSSETARRVLSLL